MYTHMYTWQGLLNSCRDMCASVCVLRTYVCNGVEAHIEWYVKTLYRYVHVRLYKYKRCLTTRFVEIWKRSFCCEIEKHLQTRKWAVVVIVTAVSTVLHGPSPMDVFPHVMCGAHMHANTLQIRTTGGPTPTCSMHSHHAEMQRVVVKGYQCTYKSGWLWTTLQMVCT